MFSWPVVFNFDQEAAVRGLDQGFAADPESPGWNARLKTLSLWGLRTVVLVCFASSCFMSDVCLAIDFNCHGQLLTRSLRAHPYPHKLLPTRLALPLRPTNFLPHATIHSAISHTDPMRGFSLK